MTPRPSHSPSAPSRAPTTSPTLAAECAAHPKCAALALEGNCCPALSSQSGAFFFYGCCENTDAPSRAPTENDAEDKTWRLDGLTLGGTITRGNRNTPRTGHDSLPVYTEFNPDFPEFGAKITLEIIDPSSSALDPSGGGTAGAACEKNAIGEGGNCIEEPDCATWPRPRGGRFALARRKLLLPDRRPGTLSGTLEP